MLVDERKATSYGFQGREDLVTLYGVAREVLDSEMRLYRQAVALGDVKEQRVHAAAVSQVLPSLIKLGLALMNLGEVSRDDLVQLLSKVPEKTAKKAVKVLRGELQGNKAS